MTERPHETGGAAPPGTAESGAPDPTLTRAGFLVVTGKGGVGKSVVAATLGRASARRGRRTVVVEVDPRENLHQLLGTAPSGGEILEAGDRVEEGGCSSSISSRGRWSTG